jgi:hypothetical protein
VGWPAEERVRRQGVSSINDERRTIIAALKPRNYCSKEGSGFHVSGHSGNLEAGLRELNDLARQVSNPSGLRLTT